MANTKHFPQPLLSHSLRFGFIGLLAAMPFFAFSYVGLNHLFGHLQWFKIWPEMVITALGVVASWLFVQDKKLRGSLTGRKINWLILAYILLHVIIAAWQHPETKALLAGLMINLRIPAMLLLGQVVAHYWSDQTTERLVALAILVPVAITTTFGVLQTSVLPKDFLKWFGYSKDTIPPFIPLHFGSKISRFSSTLRGPNPFGAYVAFGIAIILGHFKRTKHTALWWALLAVSVMALIASFSRSAWLAAVIIVLMHLYFGASKPRRRQVLLISAASLAVLIGLAVGFRRNNYVENSLLHTDETNIAADSNAGHIAAVKNAVKDISEHPLGSGPGSAGPASVNLVHHQGKIAENYYLQIAQEVGVFGLVLFLLIFGLVMLQLMQLDEFGWPYALFISGIGLAVANLLLHVWADDTLGILWWGLAGYFMYLPKKTLKV